jgi:putative DNA primase/helicase
MLKNSNLPAAHPKSGVGNVMTRQELAKALGGDINGQWINIRGPGHKSHDRSLGFRFIKTAPAGIVVNSFAGDDLILCRKHVLGLLNKIAKGAAISFEPAPTKDPQNQSRIKLARDIWEAASPISGTIAATYLKSRGCDPPGADALRFDPSCRIGNEVVPAMIALMRDIRTGEPVGVHRTALSDDGSRKRTMLDGGQAKRMLGQARGAAVMLFPQAACMGIAEGIESSISASRIFGVPVWAALSAQGLRAFPVTPGITRLRVFADHDEAGLSAAGECWRRWREAGIECEVRYPPVHASDWNNFSRERKRQWPSPT